jgi:AbrB family looped-hinge helix DNA binding protein
MALVRASQKGQVVLPKKEREKVGIKPGSRVLVKAVDDHIEIHPLPDNPVAYLYGIFEQHPESLTDALLKDRKEDLIRDGKKSARLFRSPGISKKRK